MKVLVDTHTLVWAIETPELLSKAARSTMDESEVTVSVASLWELWLKCRKKDALVADPLSWWNKCVTDPGLPTLPIRIADVIALGSLPEIHKDPFDRILVAQCVSEGIPLITKDAHLELYGIPTIW